MVENEGCWTGWRCSYYLPDSLIIKIFEQYDKLDKIPINTVKLIAW